MAYEPANVYKYWWHCFSDKMEVLLYPRLT